MDTAAGLHSLESFTMDQEPIRGQYPGHVTSISQSEDQETEAGAGETGVMEETVVYFTPGPEVRQMCPFKYLIWNCFAPKGAQGQGVPMFVCL